MMKIKKNTKMLLEEIKIKKNKLNINSFGNNFPNLYIYISYFGKTPLIHLGGKYMKGILLNQHHQLPLLYRTLLWNTSYETYNQQRVSVNA